MKPANVLPSWGKREVGYSADFQRIKDLPVRTPQDREALAREMTALLKTPEGTMTLRPIQALALYEILTRTDGTSPASKGLLVPMAVGSGKTLVFLLASVVMGASRPLGIIPASLIEKTERERMALSAHWQVDTTMQIFSYEALGRVGAAELLQIRRPDVIITDESHRLKNPKASCTRRVARWMREAPDTRLVTMSGTIISKSLRDVAHLLRWSLGAANAPIPQTEGELTEWADCLDERVNPMQRVRPGILTQLATDPDKITGTDELTRARQAFHQRLVSTPGVVCSLHEEQVNCSLYIEGKTYDVNAQTEANFEQLRTTWTTPDGWALSEAVDVWRHARELSLGMHYVWSPRPPDEWLAARGAWAKFVREVLSRSRTLDSEKQVAMACAKGDLPHETLVEWTAIRPTFQVNQEAIWHDDTALQICAKWLEKEKGIVWVEHTFFGRALSKLTGRPYFGQSGLDDKGASILDAKGPIIASIAANGTGKNLQAWSKNLITSCPTGASVWEQMLGRTHRQGQQADEVHAEFLIGCVEHFDAWHRAVGEAQMATSMLGAPQKILIGDVVVPSGVDHLQGARWRKTSQR